jgi:general stress protein CsbA
MALSRFPDSLEPALSIFVLVVLYLTSGFNRYIGIALVLLIVAGVLLRVTKRGRWRPTTKVDDR